MSEKKMVMTPEEEFKLKHCCSNVLCVNKDHSQLWRDNPAAEQHWINDIIIPLRLQYGAYNWLNFKSTKVQDPKLQYQYLMFNIN